VAISPYKSAADQFTRTDFSAESREQAEWLLDSMYEQILEGIAEAVSHTKNAMMITEHVRARLARQLCHQHLAPQGYLPIIALSPVWEQSFAESLAGQGEERQLAMAPSQLQAFIQTVRERFDEASVGGSMPVLLTSPLVRPYVRSIIERFRPLTPVMSQNEIHPSVRLRTMGQI